jgi:hypothetical protein
MKTENFNVVCQKVRTQIPRAVYSTFSVASSAIFRLSVTPLVAAISAGGLANRNDGKNSNCNMRCR